ncbi:MAG: hypothetical protein ACP5HC_06410 [Caldisericum sp.]
MTNDIAKLWDFLEAFEEKAKESLYLQKKNTYRFRAKRRQARIVRFEKSFKSSSLGGAR